MQKYIVTFLSLIIVFLVAVSALALIQMPSVASDESFYVGVTYCGDSIEEAKQLIDEVKNYTNLFVLQSGSFLYNVDAIEEIGDYAVQAGLNIILYCGGAFTANQLSSHGSLHWENLFLGIYFMDEPGGKMIDKVTTTLGTTRISTDGLAAITLYSNETGSSDLTFYQTGQIQLCERLMKTRTTLVFSNDSANNQSYPLTMSYDVFSSNTDYFANGTIINKATKYDELDGSVLESKTCIYQPNGSVYDTEGNKVSDHGDLTQFASYQELMDLYPLGSYSNVANAFTQGTLNDLSYFENKYFAKMFTSDYALYWFDYKSGYDTVFAEFVGNESRERHIALCRGAAETLGKEWGVMITWKYTQAPFLESADELYSDLSLAYSSGAQYVVVFNYENNTAHESLTEDHLAVMQKFWNTIHSDPDSLGDDFSRVAYVIPADYGFGFRSEADTIWGQFEADEHSEKIYTDVVALTSRYGAGLNILYDGPETLSKLGSYNAVYYYNQTIT